MAAMDIFKTDENGDLKEYQTLFWVPMLFQTTKQAESLIDEMLDMIQVYSHSHYWFLFLLILTCPLCNFNHRISMMIIRRPLSKQGGRV